MLPMIDAVLTVVTLEPWLIEGEVIRLKQGYCEMLLRDILVRISHYFLHLIYAGGSHGLSIEGVKNRVVNHFEVRCIAQSETG